jgi:cytochrome c-type biogenesis protein CcmH/NrfG
LARRRAAERVARLKQSNTLAAKGETQLENGDFNGAIQSFRESVKLNAKNADAIGGLSEASRRGLMPLGKMIMKRLFVSQQAVKLDQERVAYLKIGEIRYR